MKTAIEVLDAFENIRRAQRAGVYAPHKPMLILLALARVQRGEPRMVEFTAIDELLKQLLAEFSPSSAAKSRHYPFWHLATDGHGALWDLSGPREVLKRPAGATRFTRHSMRICCRRLSFWRGTRRTCSRRRLGRSCWLGLHPAQDAELPEQNCANNCFAPEGQRAVGDDRRLSTCGEFEDVRQESGSGATAPGHLKGGVCGICTPGVCQRLSAPLMTQGLQQRRM